MSMTPEDLRARFTPLGQYGRLGEEEPEITVESLREMFSGEAPPPTEEPAATPLEEAVSVQSLRERFSGGEGIVREAPEPEEDVIEWSDYGREIMAGGAGVASGMGWLVERIGEGVSASGLDYVGSSLQESGKAVREAGARASDVWINESLDSIGIDQEGLSQSARRALATEFLGEGTLGDKWRKVRLIAASSALGTMAGMGAGAIFTKGIYAMSAGGRAAASASTAGRALTVAEQELARGSMRRSAAIGYSLGEAGVAAPASGAGVQEHIMTMSEPELSKSLEYQAVYSMTEGTHRERSDYARKTVAAAASNQAFAFTMITTAALSAPFSNTMAKMLGGDDIVRGIYARAGLGAAEEATQEFLQSGSEKISENFALQNQGFDVDISEGVLEEAVGGALAGGPLGAMFGMAGRAGPEPTADTDPMLALERQQQLEAEAAGADELDQAEAGAEAAALATMNLPVMEDDGGPGEPPPSGLPVPGDVPEEGATEAEIRELLAAQAEREAAELEAEIEEDIGPHVVPPLPVPEPTPAERAREGFEEREAEVAAAAAVEVAERPRQEAEAAAARELEAAEEAAEEVEAAVEPIPEEARPTLADIAPPEVAELAEPLAPAPPGEPLLPEDAPLQLEDLRPDFFITPEGEAVPAKGGMVSLVGGAEGVPGYETVTPAAQRLRQLRTVRRSGEFPSAQDLSSTRYSDLEGVPKTFTVQGRGEIEFGRHVSARDAAYEYTDKADLDYKPPRKYAKLNKSRAGRIANEFSSLEHAPNDPEVKAAYRAMIDETVAQYETILETGLEVEFISGEDPYKGNPRLVMLDVIENNHMFVYSTREGFGSDETFDPSDNPLLEETGFEIGGKAALANDVFRVVHDYFGHIKDGVGFRAEGEENAWQSHASMYTPLARRAMTTETRGQNSWVNYGPFGDQNRTATAEDTIYADQKIGLLPSWVSEQGRAEDIAAPIVEAATTEEVDRAAQEAATSPLNELAEPTEEQIAAGNYPKGHLTPAQVGIPGIEISIENPKGSTRTGVTREGRRWRTEMKDHYGQILGTESAEGETENLDVFIGDNLDSDTIFVVDQIDQSTGNFDEHKVMLGYTNQMDALRGYKRNYEKGWKVGPVTAMTKREFRDWVKEGDKTRPVNQGLRGREPVGPVISEAEALALGERVSRRRRRGVRFRLGEEPEVPFFSRMRRTLEEKLPGQVRVSELPALLEAYVKKGGFRAEEAQYPGRGRILEPATLARAFAGRGTVSKQEILDYVDFMRPDIVEVVLNETDPAIARERGLPEEVHYEKYLPIDAGWNYREILITMPERAGRFEARHTSAHWKTRNILASLRTTDLLDTDGQEGLMLQEVQSDWHQAGRKAGYKSPAERAMRERKAKAAGRLLTLDEQELEEMLGPPPSEAGEVEEAPYSKTWRTMALRRAIRHAVLEGKKFVAWPTGRQQADMYDLRKVIDEVIYDEHGENLIVIGEDGKVLQQEVIELNGVENIIGKELTDKLKVIQKEREALRNEYSLEMQEEGDNAGSFYIYDPNGELVRDWWGEPVTISQQEHIGDLVNYTDNKYPGFESEIKLTGTALAMGGEGMEAFYDRMLVNDANSLVKRLGSKVEFLSMQVVPGESSEAHGFYVTDKMRAMVSETGQPLFRRGTPVSETVAAPAPLSVEQAEAALAPLKAQLPKLQPVVLENVEAAPQHVLDEARRTNRMNARGVYDGENLYIFANNHTNADDLIATALHEGVAHKGLDFLFGDDLPILLDDIYANAPKGEMDRVATDYNLDLSKENDRREAAEEWVAEVAERDPSNTLVKRAVGAIRDFLRRAGILSSWTEADILVLLANTRKGLEGAPISSITVQTEATVEGTGEVVQIEQRGDVALRQLNKRRNMVEELRKCIRA